MIIEEEGKKLQKSVYSLFWGNNQNLRGLIDYTQECLLCHLNEETTDYSASCNVAIDDTLDEDTCGVPYTIALELFKPFIMAIVRKKCSYSLNSAKKTIEKEIIGKSSTLHDFIVSELKQVAKEKRIVIFNSLDDGKVLNATGIITANNVVTLNLKNYNKIKVRLGECVKIFLPTSNFAQEKLKDIQVQTESINNFYELDSEGDFIRDLIKDNTIGEFAEILKNAVQNKLICNFDTIISKFVFLKPSIEDSNYYNSFIGSLALCNEEECDKKEYDDVFDDLFDNDEDEEEYR